MTAVCSSGEVLPRFLLRDGERAGAVLFLLAAGAPLSDVGLLE